MPPSNFFSPLSARERNRSVTAFNLLCCNPPLTTGLPLLCFSDAKWKLIVDAQKQNKVPFGFNLALFRVSKSGVISNARLMFVELPQCPPIGRIAAINIF